MVFNIFEDRLELFHVPEGGFKAGCAASIIFFQKNKAEQLEERADDGEFKAGRGLGHGREQFVNGEAQGRSLGGDDRVDNNILMFYFL